MGGPGGPEAPTPLPPDFGRSGNPIKTRGADYALLPDPRIQKAI